MPQKSNKNKGPLILEAIRLEQGEDEKGTFFFSDACITGHPLRVERWQRGTMLRRGLEVTFQPVVGHNATRKAEFPLLFLL